MGISLQETILSYCQQGKQAYRLLSQVSDTQKNKALQAMAAALEEQCSAILTANDKDIAAAQAAHKTPDFIDRLQLTAERIAAMAASLLSIAQQPDPVGRLLAEWDVESGLHIERVAVPLGLIAVIYESRPNVTADAAGLCLKSGNAVILRGGSDSFHSSAAIVAALHQGLTAAALPITAIQLIPTTDRDAVGYLLKSDQFIDVVIPRGGKALIERVMADSRVPVLKHLDGICHTYIHSEADIAMAVAIVLNAKMRRPGICGATETVLMDADILATHLPPMIAALTSAGCELRGDPAVCAFDKSMVPAQPADWSTEYLAAILSIKAVANVDAAIAHIQQYGSGHTDAIVTDNNTVADHFLTYIDDAITMHNCSTQFADGGEFGMGAEIGIATGRLHARGPVGVEQLTTFKYRVTGSGQIRA